MKTIRRKWSKWFAIPLAVVLVLAIVLPMQLSREPTPVFASGVDATSITLTGQDTGNDFTYVQFDIDWDYSWRDAENWDAIWVFVKYQVSGGDWAHATLSTTSTDHSITANNGVAGTITVTTDGKGVLAHRLGPGTGNINWDGVKLKWQYGTDGLADDDLVTVKVFVIEMVYIPEDAFYVGDADNTLDSCFREGSTSGPFEITSEGEILVGETAGRLYYDDDGGSGGDRVGPIPAAFPKGFNDFYIMKYEVSQGQYAEFLNTLTSTQATARFPGQTANRHKIELQGGVYGTDADGDNILNESNDGEWVAANWLVWADGTAYTDWAGLRPMTELEFEKAARGTAAVVDDECAWGTATLVQANGTDNTDTASETATAASGNPNVVYDSGTTGPLRGGSFTSASDTRQEAGASYYGVMELSGNLWERTVTVGHVTGRAFTGIHGDGSLTSGGDADASLWPGTDVVGGGARGGGWSSTSDAYLRTADRSYGYATVTTRNNYYGFRAVRTAP